MPVATFGLVMIVKNVETIISRILDHADNWDQVVIVDTGSTDGTVELIESKYPSVELHHFEWAFDFSKARNFALSHVTTDVWMWLDSDDAFTPDTLIGWKRLAQELAENKYEANHVILPYHYALDSNGNPLVVQYRERIFLGRDWEWREPLHEVCCSTLTEEPPHVACAQYPVVHKSDKNPEETANRNWNILITHFLKGDTSDRTLYYLMRMATERGQPELALHYGNTILARSPGGYHEYEARVGVGKAFIDIAVATKNDWLYTAAESVLSAAIRSFPERNEARAVLIESSIQQQDWDKAIELAGTLAVDIPETVATLATEMYGTYKFVLLAHLEMRRGTQAYYGFQNHLTSLDCARPHPLAMSNEAVYRNYMRDNGIGIMYADPRLAPHAAHVRERLLEEGFFRDVWVCTHPGCMAYSTRVHVHMTEHTNTLTYTDSAPDVQVVVVTYEPNFEQIFNADILLPLPIVTQRSELVTEAIKTPGMYHAGSLVEAFDVSKTFFAEKVMITIGEIDATTVEFSDKVKMNHLYVSVVDNQIVGIAGWRETVVSCYSIDNQTITVPKGIDVMMSEGAPEGLIREQNPTESDVVFIATGIEEWDGSTPYRQGIGASENCLIYLAEQLTVFGHFVRVFAPVRFPRIINGVYYYPLEMEKAFDFSKVGLLVASRCPQMLEGRRAKKQVLWMHDLPQSYAPHLNSKLVIDHYIAVSEWQRDNAIQIGYPEDKIVVLENAVKMPECKPEIARNKERIVWLSQPERGVENLFAFWKAEPKVFTDLWVAYGFTNFYGYHGLQAFQDVCYWRHVLRQMGAKIVGRLNRRQLSKLRRSSGYWLYPSDFPETFCVTALEAVQDGLGIMVCANGATAQTVRQNTIGAQYVAYEGVYTPDKQTTWLQDFKAMRLEEYGDFQYSPQVIQDRMWSNTASRWSDLCS